MAGLAGIVKIDLCVSGGLFWGIFSIKFINFFLKKFWLVLSKLSSTRLEKNCGETFF